MPFVCEQVKDIFIEWSKDKGISPSFFCKYYAEINVNAMYNNDKQRILEELDAIYKDRQESVGYYEKSEDKQRFYK